VALAAWSLVRGGERPVERVFAENCARCHGTSLRGGQAASLVDDVWAHGGDDASLARSIREGHQVESGMPAFGGALSEREIRALVIYIRERADKARRAQTTDASPRGDAVVQSEEHAFRVETVVEGVETPWSVAFLPDGRMLVTEKAGRLRIVERGRLLAPVAGVPPVSSEGQGGLMGVAVHPDWAGNGWIYLSLSDPGKDDSAMTKVIRGRLREGRLVDQETIFEAPGALYRRGKVHFGSRFVFDGKGHLFFTIGERGHQDDAQDLSRPNGKVHRVLEDGGVPPDNPFVGRAGALATIWSYGHRNPQGLTQHMATGALYAAEHGPRGGDELNLVLPGRNYGWPVITYGMNYDGSPITELTAKEGMEQPLVHWTPSIAVGAIDFYAGDRFPRWRDHLLVASLAAQELRRVVVEGERVTKQEVLLARIGRVRDVVVGPDGLVYLAFNQPDRIARLVPVP
jgi:glucose/arabinose dehydrogenase